MTDGPIISGHLHREKMETPKRITSAANPVISTFRSLHSAKGRKENRLFLAEGARTASEALDAAAPVKFALVDEGSEEGFAAEIERLTNLGAQVYILGPGLISKACDAKTPQGIALAIELPEPLEIKGDRIIALDGIADPGNMGTILRTAQAFGCGAALISKDSADPFSPKAVRAGMGAHFKMSVNYGLDLPKELESLAIKGYSVIGMHLNGSEKLPERADKCVLVIGSEAFGMSEGSARACASLFRIPMNNNAESLNAAVAAGIAMFLILGS